MPLTVRAARFLITLDVAFALVGLAILLATAFATFEPVVFLLLLHGAAMTGLAGWFLSRWRTRRRRLLQAIVAYEVWLIAARLALLAADSDLTWPALLHPDTLLPVAVIVALLLPAGRRWFRA